MKQGLRCQRICILSLLSLCVCAPIILVSRRLSSFTSTLADKEFVEDVSSINYRRDTHQLNAIQQDIGEDRKEPQHVLYKERESNSVVRDGGYKSVGSGIHRKVAEEKRKIQPKSRSPSVIKKGKIIQTPTREGNERSQPRGVTDAKVREIKDHVIRAKAYLHFTPPKSNSHLVKELKLRIREVERAVGEATKDADLSRSALQKMKAMAVTLSKADRVYPDCSSMVTRLRAMTYNTEEQVRTQKNYADYLVQLTSRTTPKGLHCLSMRLTADYFALEPEERELPNQHKLHEPCLYHYVIFSDNILACSVVVNSTISASLEPDKVVFHVVTDGINLPAMTMWFLLKSPRQATIEIKSIDSFEWLSSKLMEQHSQDPRYSSVLNHLRFYLPEMFPTFEKIVVLEHDVVVQRDLRGLWDVNMKGKVNGAVETCKQSEASFRRMDMLINFSDPSIAEKFDVKACTWAFGVNVFDLGEWRRQNLTAVYHRYLELGKKKRLWSGGSLPLGLVTFYNQTVGLDRRWHALGLGYDSGIGRVEIERAAVIHYDGNMKPWLDIGIGKYKGYWQRYINYQHTYLQQCNIHE